MKGADVCLHQMKGNSNNDEGDSVIIDCVSTDDAGYWEIYAAVGTRVYPNVTMTGHEFKPINSFNRILYAEEIFLFLRLLAGSLFQVTISWM